MNANGGLNGYRTAREASPHSKDEEITEALTALWESVSAAKDDFCGEQREWHLPRLNRALIIISSIFPKQCIRAMSKAKTPYGDLVCPEE